MALLCRPTRVLSTTWGDQKARFVTKTLLWIKKAILSAQLALPLTGAPALGVRPRAAPAPPRPLGAGAAAPGRDPPSPPIPVPQGQGGPYLRVDFVHGLDACVLGKGRKRGSEPWPQGDAGGGGRRLCEHGTGTTGVPWARTPSRRRGPSTPPSLRHQTQQGREPTLPPPGQPQHPPCAHLAVLLHPPPPLLEGAGVSRVGAEAVAAVRAGGRHAQRGEGRHQAQDPRLARGGGGHRGPRHRVAAAGT